MTDDLSKMTPAQKEALAARALRSQERARQRSAAYRDRKRGEGMVQVSIWVPEARAAEFRLAFQRHVEKFMSAASPQALTTTRAAADQSAVKAAAAKQ